MAKFEGEVARKEMRVQARFRGNSRKIRKKGERKLAGKWSNVLCIQVGKGSFEAFSAFY
jgi:hypothetical protein